MKNLVTALRYSVIVVSLTTMVLHVVNEFSYSSSHALGRQTTGPMTLFWAIGITTIVIFALTPLMPRFRSHRETGAVVPNRVRNALDSFRDGLLILDEEERIVMANRKFCETLQIPSNRLVGKHASQLNWVCSDLARQEDLPWRRILAPNQEEAQTSDMELTESAAQHSVVSEPLLSYRMDDGSLRFFAVNVSTIQPTDTSHQGVLATFRDVTSDEQQRAEMERRLAMLRANREEISQRNRALEQLASRDALTDCLNRRRFMENFEAALASAKSDGEPLACLMFDNDHFKRVNDTFGHGIGDEVLRRVASALSNQFDDIGEVCRYGGEEFCVMLPNMDLDEAAELADSARESVENIRLEEPRELRISVSVGVTSLQDTMTSTTTLLEQADKCLYVAKSRGRNCVVSHSPEVAAISIQSLSDGIPAEVQSEAPRPRGEAHLDADGHARDVPFHAVMALVSALAHRDARTAQHCRRVADLCVRAAPTLLDQRSTYILEMAALLHDIGKIALPDEVLQKPGPLTPDQWRMIARHHHIGVEIVSGTFHHPELCDIVRTHLAYYAGRSVVAGLPTGRDIPLGARLLTIADTYDVIMSDRPHRKGRSHEEAVSELRRCAGRQFDPLLVEHFIASVEFASHEVKPHSLSSPAVSRQTALQIGLQIEGLADAMDRRKLPELKDLASRLTSTAKQHHLDTIAEAAQRLGQNAADETSDWIHMLEDTQHLLDACRSTQSAFIVDSKLESSP
ncbi:MAG: diguanylate cyclase [Planctomycetota bacterium]